MERGRDTRDRLLAAAAEVFAHYGPHHATVRLIAERAGAHAAAVNYHFRTKDGLYRETVRGAFREMAALDTALDGAAAADEDPARRVRRFVGALLGGLEDRRRHRLFMQLLAWEIQFPTGALTDLEETEMARHHGQAQAVVTRFFPDGTAPGVTLAAGMWLIGQCVIFNHVFDAIERAAPDLAEDADHRERLIDLVVALALGGLGGQAGRDPAHDGPWRAWDRVQPPAVAG
ncbi:MAG: CerR family C-terminal domain-containing protein [Rhodobacterales bacterium]|nr:CerR family C-terminal domain-containing protein [Rhodobacterales bacterium]